MATFGKRRSKVENKLAHTLLIELLAYQFASPVRWIETQDRILRDFKAERVIEIGPADTLTSMMKQTWDLHYQDHDAALGLQRSFLGSQANSADIYYDHHVDRKEEPRQPLQEDDAQRTAPAEAPLVPQPNVTSEATSVVEIPDRAVPLHAIVLPIVAFKLKRSVEDIKREKSIKHLVGGRSTLENEIVGDLFAEFPNQLPEKTEELSLGELCEKLESSHTGKLGKQAESLLSKMLSSKFPGDFDRASVRQYLKSNWGFPPGHQDAAMMFALARAPAARLSTAAAKGFLDTVAKCYIQHEGLPMPQRSAASTAQVMAVDPAAFLALKSQQTEVAKDVMEALSRHVNKPSVQTNVQVPGDGASDPTAELDLWLNEHGDDYAEGIRPTFSAKKARTYDSFWNWNSQDIAELADELQQDTPVSPFTLSELMLCIPNRSDDRSIMQLDFLCKQLPDCDVLQNLLTKCRLWNSQPPVFIDRALDLAPTTTLEEDGTIKYEELTRSPVMKREDSATDFVESAGGKELTFPVMTFQKGKPVHSEGLTTTLKKVLALSTADGFTLAGKNVLLTGAGRNSIGIEILKNLLCGGARVLLTTSTHKTETLEMYQDIYTRYGSRGSLLKVVPLNQGSYQDIQALTRYLEANEEWEFDFVFPFAAVSEVGRELDSIDSRSELAHRMMLTNVLRLLGAVARVKKARDIVSRPAQIILPLSPNHGLMGNDGLYAESKIALETLFSKWVSESWHDYLSLCGVNIGWTRGTGLMNDNDLVSQGVEALGVRTFSSSQMAAYITCLTARSIRTACQATPIMVDYSGGLGAVPSLKQSLMHIRNDLFSQSEILKAIRNEDLLEKAVVTGKKEREASVPVVSAKVNVRLQLPPLPDFDSELAPLAEDLAGMVDLDRVVVITGFAEVGPHGNSRTRWEKEVDGVLSMEGSIEMAWIMGLIKHHSWEKNGEMFSGWVDAKTKQPIPDHEIHDQYKDQISEQSGIRQILPEVTDNAYDPERKVVMQEVVIQKDQAPFEATQEVATEFQRQHGDKVRIVQTDCSWTVQILAGATVLIPKSVKFNRTVAGQIPQGWSAKRYGIPDDIIEQVDPVTLFSLVCTVEALLSSGIIDPYELYEHIHVTEVGNCIGSSMGGLSSLRQMHKDRFVDKSVQSDILQETFINTTSAWVNMLLLSSSGPIKTPVGACATSLESLDTGYDLIVAGKAKVCIVGGVEDFVEDVSFEFGSMKATNDSISEFEAGRSPREMSRPTASSRSGFVESQGCGVQVLTTAALAIQMGLPIFGVVALSSMASDKTGRSVPAPGRGVLSNAREAGKIPSRSLDIRYRKRALAARKHQIAASLAIDLETVEEEATKLGADDASVYRKENIDFFHRQAARETAEACFALGNNFWHNQTDISPIRGSLAAWNLGVDDITVASLHGTSTVLNDLNECSVIQAQMNHLGRQEGNLLHCVCQKWLTGHSKGAAGAWMVNGALQILGSGVIPGNRNADNVDTKLRENKTLLFSNKSRSASHVKAVSITSFGFGQKGAQAIVLHPRYVLATLGRVEFEGYAEKRRQRHERACQYLWNSLVRENMVALKQLPPYGVSGEETALLDPTARFTRGL